MNSPRDRVVEDIHILAYLYHWSFNECMNMPSSMRRVFADRALKQNKEENKAASSVNGGKTPKTYREG